VNPLATILLPISRQLPLSPMMVFPVGEHALDVTVERLHDADLRHIVGPPFSKPVSMLGWPLAIRANCALAWGVWR